MHTLIKNILLLKIITIGWQCRVTTNLQFAKNIVSIKHNKAKHNEVRYAYQDDSTKICLLGYLRKWVSQVVHINYTMEKLIYIFAWLCVLSHSVVNNSLQPHGLEAHQVPLSMGFSRQEYRSGLPFLSPGDLPDPGTEPGSPTLQANSLPAQILYHLSHKEASAIYSCFMYWTSNLKQSIRVIYIFICILHKNLKFNQCQYDIGSVF